METLAWAWGAMLAGAPTDDLVLLAGGVTAFVAEMVWFDELGAERGLAIPAEPLPAAVDYHDHLRRMAGEPHPVTLAAMWAVETAYLEAWRTALPGAEDRGSVYRVDH